MRHIAFAILGNVRSIAIQTRHVMLSDEFDSR